MPNVMFKKLKLFKTKKKTNTTRDYPFSKLNLRQVAGYFPL